VLKPANAGRDSGGCKRELKGKSYLPPSIPFNTVPVSLDRKSDSEPATGHQFFSLKHDFAISKYFNPFLTPQ
jgi:hypothetical protein